MKRKEGKKIDEFRIKFRFGPHDIIVSKKEPVLTKIIQVFAREKILQQHKVLKYCIELYFPDYQLAIEVDEKGHQDEMGIEKKKEKIK